jgi:hypothetical protein
MAMGQAAGTAAAICASEKKRPADIDISLLQRRLVEQDAILK